MRYFILSIILFSSTAAIATPGRTVENSVRYPENARYVFLFGDLHGGQQYLLDTWTGRMWDLAESEKGPMLVPLAAMCGKGKLSFNPDCSNSYEVPGAP